MAGRIRFSVEKGAMSCVGNQERFEDAYDFDSYWAGPDTGRRAALVERLDQRFHWAYMVSGTEPGRCRKRRDVPEPRERQSTSATTWCSAQKPTPRLIQTANN
jgi:hypothetical protein